MDFYDILSLNNYNLFSYYKNSIQEGFTNDNEISDAKKKVDEIKKKINDAKKILDDYESEKKTVNDQFTKLNNELNALKKNETDVNKSIQDIQDQMNSVQKQIDDLNQNVKSKQNELTNKKNQLANVNNVYNSINNNCHTKTAFGTWVKFGKSWRYCDPPKYDYKTKPKNNEQRKTELINTSNVIKKEIKILEDEIKSLIKNNNPKIKSLESTNATHKNNLKNKQNERNKITKNINNKNNQINQTKKKLDEITKKIDDYTKSIDLKKIEEQLKIAEIQLGELEYAREMEKSNNFYTENYKVTTPSVQSCGFYFTTNNFDCIYSITTTDVNQFVEYNIIKNKKKFCFNIDENNKNILYSIVNNQPIQFNVINKYTNNKYSILFDITVKNTHFIHCLTKFMENCYKNNNLTFDLNSQMNIINLHISNKKCTIQLKNLNIHSEKSTILSNININNINKIIYLDKEIDLNKNYSYGQLYYSPIQYYDCIVMNH